MPWCRRIGWPLSGGPVPKTRRISLTLPWTPRAALPVATQLLPIHFRDGAPNLINFQVEHGVYIVPKVLDRGYLSLGKERFEFLQEGR